MSLEDAPATKHPFLSRFWPPLILVAIMWFVQAADQVLPGSFRGAGIRSWDLSGLPGILISPFLHADWAHLIANSLPLLVLGWLVSIEGGGKFWLNTLIIALVGGAGVWLVNAPGQLTVGASTLVFGYFAYVVARVFVGSASMGHRIGYAVIALVIIALYGGAMVGGIIGAGPGVSWQAHLFGAIGGMVAALLTGRSATMEP